MSRKEFVEGWYNYDAPETETENLDKNPVNDDESEPESETENLEQNPVNSKENQSETEIENPNKNPVNYDESEPETQNLKSSEAANVEVNMLSSELHPDLDESDIEPIDSDYISSDEINMIKASFE